MPSGRDVIILFGGTSHERRVSVASAQNVSQHLPSAETWFIDPSGRVFAARREAVRSHKRPFETDFVVPGPSRYPSLTAMLDDTQHHHKVFFLALHGGAGEDGSVQRELEKRGIAFTGSGSEASARAFDKVQAKNIVRARGVRVAESVVLAQKSAEATRGALATLQAKLGRVIVKPVADGSSVGLHHVRGAEDIDRVTAALMANPEIAYLAEAFVSGTELTVGVLDEGSGARALVVSEVRLAPGRAFDFEGKYLGLGTVELTPAEVPSEVAQAVQAVAVTAHDALGCEGYSRTDIIVDESGPCFLEINTLPGLTKASFIPQQLAAEGISLLHFLETQIALAQRRRANAEG